jgi:hypothetical protein
VVGKFKGIHYRNALRKNFSMAPNDRKGATRRDITMIKESNHVVV